MKAVFIVVGYPISYNPSRGIFTHRTVKALAKHIQVEVVHMRAWRPGFPVLERRIWDGVPVRTVSIPQIPFLGRAKYLNTEILTRFAKQFALPVLREADVIHSTGIYPTGKIANFWATLVGKPHVSQVIGSDLNIYLKNMKLLGAGRNWLLNLDGVSCNSEAIFMELSALGLQIPNVCVIYRGVDTKIFSPQKDAFNSHVGWHPLRFLFLGGFQTQNCRRFAQDNIKGGHILLAAWEKVETKIGRSSLVLGGPGMNLSSTQPWIASLQHPEAVQILPVVPPEMVPGLLRSCDVTIIPSLSEGLPNLANESQACGRPVLGSDAGGIPETVVHNSTGRIVPKGNVDQLAEGIVWFYEHQDQIAEMGRQARKHMIADFNWETSAQKMMSLFYSAITHHHQQNIE